MYVVISVTMAVIPSLYLVAYFYQQDRRRPEPRGLLLAAFAWGFTATIPAGMIETLFSPLADVLFGSQFLRSLVEAYIVVALCEEGLKLLVVMRCCYRRRAFDEVMDGIVYTVVASLGFACLENIIFVVDAGLKVALARAFTAVPMHAIASAVMGYHVGLSHFAPTAGARRLQLAKGLTWAVAYHGSYDLLLLAQPQIGRHAFSTVGLLLVGGLFHVRRLIREAQVLDMAAQRA
ncbi:MAG: PrsW family intramembrane metalloprotease [Calditrichaeota bacterium]|nr:PrsW family intramembrane metalloprotease [Calditrichota bacterium]